MTTFIWLPGVAQVAQSVVKNPPANAGEARDTGSISGSGRSPAVGNGNSLLYSCLKNSMDRGAWRATVHGGHKESDTSERLSMHAGESRMGCHCSVASVSPQFVGELM